MAFQKKLIWLPFFSITAMSLPYMFLDLFTINSNHSLPNAVQRAALCSLTVNLTFENVQQVLKRNRVWWGKGPGPYSGIFKAPAGRPSSAVLGCMWWFIVLHKDYGLLESWGLLPVPLLEESIFQKLAVGLGVEFQSIFNLKIGPTISSLMMAAAHTSTS